MLKTTIMTEYDPGPKSLSVRKIVSIIDDLLVQFNRVEGVVPDTSICHLPISCHSLSNIINVTLRGSDAEDWGIIYT